MTREKYAGWTAQDGILWRSEQLCEHSDDARVTVSSKYMFREEKYRIVVNDNQLGEEAVVLNSSPSDWDEIVDDALLFAEGYVTGLEAQ